MINKDKKYFISFIEEGVMNPDYSDCIGGRVEIHNNEIGKEIEEIRFLTKRQYLFSLFRDIIDFQELYGKEILSLRKYIEARFQDGYEK